MTQYSCITFLHVKLLQTVIIRSRQKSIYLVIKPCTRASAFHRQSAALRSRWRRILLNAFTYFTAHLRAPRLLFSSKASVISVFLRTNETLKLEPFSMPRALLSSQFINVCLFNFPIHKDFFFILKLFSPTSIGIAWPACTQSCSACSMHSDPPPCGLLIPLFQTRP